MQCLPLSLSTTLCQGLSPNLMLTPPPFGLSNQPACPGDFQSGITSRLSHPPSFYVGSGILNPSAISTSSSHCQPALLGCLKETLIWSWSSWFLGSCLSHASSVTFSKFFKVPQPLPVLCLRERTLTELTLSGLPRNQMRRKCFKIFNVRAVEERLDLWTCSRCGKEVLSGAGGWEAHRRWRTWILTLTSLSWTHCLFSTITSYCKPWPLRDLQWGELDWECPQRHSSHLRHSQSSLMSTLRAA